MIESILILKSQFLETGYLLERFSVIFYGFTTSNGSLGSKWDSRESRKRHFRKKERKHNTI